MSIVKSIAVQSACVNFDDSCYAGLDAQEIAERWAEIDRLIHRINRAARKEEEKR